MAYIKMAYIWRRAEHQRSLSHPQFRHWFRRSRTRNHRRESWCWPSWWRWAHFPSRFHHLLLRRCTPAGWEDKHTHTDTQRHRHRQISWTSCLKIVMFLLQTYLPISRILGWNKNFCALTGWPVVVSYAQLNFHVCHITEIDRYNVFVY